ncbi:MAG: glycosyltransferase family 2 protein [Octadecabacter sp.]|nr:glycosyltransferase family 2 protein [Octadecabacter sp.]
MRVTAITPMKNEGPFILEWLAYHRLIGINDFIVFTNDCTDGTDAILERLDELGLVRHLPNPSCVTKAEGGHHWAAMAYVDAMPRLRRSDWFVSFDVDEFICVKTGLGRLSDLFEACASADLISMNQLNFGCAGHETYAPDVPLLARFDRAMAPDNAAYNWDRARGVKTITRGTAGIDRIGNHSPEASRDDLVWVNGSGVPLPPEVYKGTLKSTKGGVSGNDLVQLNHYALRSMENFLVKTERGDANRAVTEEVKYWRQYWNQYDDNLVKDRTIQRWLPDVQEAVDDLLQDSELAQLHAASVAHHKAAIARLRVMEPQATILKQIKGLHIRKLEREQAA